MVNAAGSIHRIGFEPDEVAFVPLDFLFFSWLIFVLRWLVGGSPSPQPSPPGRGRGFGRCLKIRMSCLHWSRGLAFAQKAHHHPRASCSRSAANASPSPGGEGRGEGELRDGS